jgi:hypothetical protein
VAGESPQVYGSRCAATAWSHTIHQLQCSGSTLHDSPPQYLTPNPQRDPTQRPSDPLVPARSFEYISATAAANSRACSDSKRRQHHSVQRAASFSNILDCLRNATRNPAPLAVSVFRSTGPALPANHWLSLETAYFWGPAPHHSQSSSHPKSAIQPLA